MRIDGNVNMTVQTTTIQLNEKLAQLRRELAALRSFITQAALPRDPSMLRTAETKLAQLTYDIGQLERGRPT